MLYLARIGSMKENIFYELLTKAVSSEKPLCEVKRHFETKYEGLTVRVETVETMPETIFPCGRSYLENIWVAYTDEERKLHEEWKAENAQAYDLRNDLERLIRERYKKLNYTAICNRDDIILETDNDGTLIKHLPIAGEAFLAKVGEGTEV
jgi:hypothetical protein